VRLETLHLPCARQFSTLPEGGKVLQDTSLSRRLVSAASSISVTRFTQDEVSAFVANGDGKSYSITLTAVRSFCGCGDAMVRGKTCKPAVALALYVMRTPETAWATEMRAPDLSLAKVRRHEETAPF
jgi:uncharacterized Zn finger protein